MKSLLSLFDYSGNWSGHYADNGWDVLMVDAKHQGNPFAWITDALEFNTCEFMLENEIEADGLIAAPPCTDFAGSGARWWPGKDTSGATDLSLQLIYQVLHVVDFLKPDFWVLENPVGRLNKLIPEAWESFDGVKLGKPQYFNPCDYAGYLDLSSDDLDYLAEIDKKDGQGITREDWNHIIKCNAYTKKTGLWGEFTMPEKKPIKPVKAGGPTIGYSALNRLGGKSEKTKELRSVTPDGFSRAFYQANQGGYNRWIAEDDPDYYKEVA